MTSGTWGVLVAVLALASALLGTKISVMSAQRAQATADEALDLAKRQHEIVVAQRWVLEPLDAASEQDWWNEPAVLKLHLVGEKPARSVRLFGGCMDPWEAQPAELPTPRKFAVVSPGTPIDVELAPEFTRHAIFDMHDKGTPDDPAPEVNVEWTDPEDKLQVISLIIPPTPWAPAPPLGVY